MSEPELYLVSNKPDDYNSCKTELVETSPDLADQYYRTKSVSAEDAVVLAKYFRIIPFSEESERNSDTRFYGNE